MRIVIDLQSAQSESRFRGIGRYSLSLALAMARNAGNHEIWLAVNSAFFKSIPEIRNTFYNMIPQERIRVFDVPAPVAECEPNNAWRVRAAEKIREHFMQKLKPDVIHIASLFEGPNENTVTSVGKFVQEVNTVVTLYDLIPLLNETVYLSSQIRKDWYYGKLASLKKAALLLAISDFSRSEAIKVLQLSADRVVNISAAIDERFGPIMLSTERINHLRSRYNINRKMIMYAPGGFDERKNFDGLINAYALLPVELRNNHQLVIVSKVNDNSRAQLKQLRHRARLSESDLVITGYVSDDDLVFLYNLATLFVFPSKYEGFGLPALEAMACGTPTIGSNTTSIPEVIGCDEALFDPTSAQSMAKKMAQVLENQNLQHHLREHGLRQARKFSWDNSAKIALQAFELMMCEKERQQSNTKTFHSTPSYSQLVKSISEIPRISEVSNQDFALVARSIAFNSSETVPRQLLVDISELVERDSKSGIQRVVRSILLELLNRPPHGYEVRPIYFDGHQYRCAQKFTSRFLCRTEPESTDEIAEFNQDDVYLALDLIAHITHAVQPLHMRLQCIGMKMYFVVYDILVVKRPDWGNPSTTLIFSEWLRSISQVATGLICISRAVADELQEWLKHNPPARLAGPVVDSFHLGADIENSLPTKGIPDSAENVLSALTKWPSFLMVGTLEPRKGHAQALAAFEQLWTQGADVNLIIVGKQGWMVEALVNRLRRHAEIGKRLFWLEGISDEYLDKIYATSACLIAASAGEGFGLPLIEAAQHKLPIIARDIPVFREVVGEHAYYFSGFEPHVLAKTINSWLALNAKGKAPQSAKMSWLTWKQSAVQLQKKIRLDCEGHQNKRPEHQLLVDASELVQRDVKSGIQRVTRSILNELLANPPGGYQVEPVYATIEQGYRYARFFTAWHLGRPASNFADHPIQYQPGDVFLALDLQPEVVISQQRFFEALRHQGVEVYFFVYDLLPVTLPKAFPAGTDKLYEKWLEVVAKSDGAICISKTTADQLGTWLKENGFQRENNFRISWSHIGADIENSLPTKGIPDSAENVLSALTKWPSFLMVSTLEPRKSHAQALAAFEQLWTQGADVNLIIVGKQGWMVEALVKRLRHHAELGKRLFWLEGISDEYLDKIYAASACLLAASEGEGFGLPLIEAAQHRLPIIARDIPVFREVAGEHAFYFSGFEPQILANAINRWLALNAKGKAPQSAKMPWLTWQQSTRQLLQAIICSGE